MLFEAADAVEVPFAFVAVIVNVYAVLNAKVPVTVNGVDVPLVLNEIEGDDVVV
jgi:hypothetical protein